MKGIVLLCLALAACTLGAQTRIYDSANQRWCEMDTVRRAMQKSRIVFVGEYHDHVLGHAVELELLETYCSAQPNVAVAFEMFERDVQHILDGYLDGEVTEQFFLEHSRPWNNYREAYRPLVEFAKAGQLPVLAMNVPRRYAACVAKGKEAFFAELPALERNFLAEEIVAEPGEYRDKFYKTMAGHAPPAVIELYYRAQCFKDGTMAKSIVEFLNLFPLSCVISFTGAFHSDQKLGLVSQVLRRMPSAKILVITIIPVEPGTNPNPAEYAHLADFVFFAPGNPESRSRNLGFETPVIME